MFWYFCPILQHKNFQRIRESGGLSPFLKVGDLSPAPCSDVYGLDLIQLEAKTMRPRPKPKWPQSLTYPSMSNKYYLLTYLLTYNDQSKTIGITKFTAVKRQTILVTNNMHSTWKTCPPSVIDLYPHKDIPPA